MNIIATIIPIFAIIMLGLAAKKMSFMPPEFLGPANRLVYYLAIPAMVFRSIAGTDFHAQFHPYVLTGVLLAIFIVFIIAWVTCSVFAVKRNRRGTFIQTSLHGNLGYIAFAVAFYFLGNEGLVRASIIAGFVMVLQNLLAVIALQVYSAGGHARANVFKIITAILINPVIISAMAGIFFSLRSIPIPVIIDRSLDILGSLALPLALLVIGASLSFKLIGSRGLSIMFVALLKLLLLPALGFALFRLFNLSPQDYLPGLIILASPTATVTFVIAKEMNGDPDFAVAAISASTMLSAISLSLWLNFAA